MKSLTDLNVHKTVERTTCYVLCTPYRVPVCFLCSDPYACVCVYDATSFCVIEEDSIFLCLS